MGFSFKIKGDTKKFLTNIHKKPNKFNRNDKFVNKNPDF